MLPCHKLTARARILLLVLAFAIVATVQPPRPAMAQDIPPDALQEAARRTGLSPEELLRRYQEQAGQQATSVADTAQAPGRTSLQGIDDSQPPATGRGETSYWPERPAVILPGAPVEGEELSVAAAESALTAFSTAPAKLTFFGRDFFNLPPSTFSPPSFGPVPADYLVGVGDEIVVDVYGDVEFRLSRVVDRDGTIILPKGGKVVCHNRTLAQVTKAVRETLARSYSGINQGTINVDVTLGALRAIRVFVVGDASQPGAYDLSSLATVFTALSACGGPGENGSLRDVRLMRGGEQIAVLDVYDYLMGGVREGDAILRDGDTVFVPQRGRTVLLQGAVHRPAFYELRPGEDLGDLLRFGGGFTPQAATEVVHIERILPPAQRRPDLPDRTYRDVALDPATGTVATPADGALLDGDVVTVDAIEDRLWGWVRVVGHVKRPGRYEYHDGMTASQLVQTAGGAWPDVLRDLAVIDRTDTQEHYTAVQVPLGAILRGDAPDVPLQERDLLRVFSAGDMLNRSEVNVSGEVKNPQSFAYRTGMTLADALVRAGGLLAAADPSRVEIQRLRADKVFSDAATLPEGTSVDVIFVALDGNWMQGEASTPLKPFDRIVVRKLPWYEFQRVVTVKGEVLYGGQFSLEEKDETLSSVITRAGGLKATAYAPAARVVRKNLGNIAVELVAALAHPGGPQDIILQDGDQIIVPEQQYTVKVVGEVGFPTSLVYENGKHINWYVNRAGGFLEKADKKRTRVVHPNGMSLPNKGNSEVLPGSTIVVPVQPPPEGASTLEKLKEIAAIMASAATIYLVIDRTTN